MKEWLRRGLIVIVGAVPATALLALAQIPFIAAFSAISEQPATALLVIGWFGLATTGTLALWIAPFRPVSCRLAIGLLAGLLAISPFWFFLIRDWVEDQNDQFNVMNILITGPTLVAAVLIIYLLSNASNRTG
jgi:Sec-independent protein secretion pathway component TatC